MIDSDNVNVEKWNISVIKEALCKDNWDAISFNRFPYYDIWPLFYGKFKHHCWGFCGPNGWDPYTLVIHMMYDILSKLDNLPEGELLECYSAFCGFVIYRTNKFKNIVYDGLYSNIKTLITDEERDQALEHVRETFPNTYINESWVEHCEHVYFHLSAIKENQARIRISKKSLQ